MKRLISLTPAEKRFLDDAVAAAERASGKKLNQPNRHIVLNRARAQIESQRQAERQRSAREEAAAGGIYLVASASAASLIATFVGFVGVQGETAWYSLRCIVIRPRKTHQSDFGRFSGGKTCSFVAEGAETP